MSDSEIEPERDCPVCGEKMVIGHLANAQPLYGNIFGIQWVKKGAHTSSYTMKAYVCPSCGKVDLWLSDKQLKEHPIENR